ncbi:diiron oxygenase [Kineosporia succinea]|uniref:Para-aminobenzoate N-oxygenase AurF n=1 Tax=Kineosporia succinea TaxID=84632 RepID=A0ABT9NVE0_9ACTN|nr:diiron oxygenase [Kineosporia succinea]MDP9824397.1 hypothetical protein [Kineosporia succinea]
MPSVTDFDTVEFRQLLDRLSAKASDDYYNPYVTFEWPDELPPDVLWMTPELLSVWGTAVFDELDEAALVRLSRFESVNFYSLNVHGIRELLIEVTRRVHSPGFEIPSDFFHHFIGEENEHMWFFATFCTRYGGKIYTDKTLPLTGTQRPGWENFLVFARILVFEQIVDHYNAKMAEDSRLHPTVRHINRIHHQDESRHIAFGCRIVQLLWDQMKLTGTPPDEQRELATYLRRYIDTCMESFYNPTVYRDAGLPGGFELRKQLLADPARAREHARVLRKTNDFFTRIGVFEPA